MKTKILIATLIGALVAGCGGSNSAAPPGPVVPTVSAVADQNTTANGDSAPITFTVSASDLASLTIVASSDNQTIVPDSGLVLAGSGSSRSVTVSPVIDRLGDAFITIVATDQDGLSASASFLLTVVPQEKSVQQFTRSSFAEEPDADPTLINAVTFIQDADEDDFEDLLAQ